MIDTDFWLTVWQLRERLAKLPQDAKVYYERIEDSYFIDNWKTKPMLWVNDDMDEWIYAFQCRYNAKENAVCITAHY
jgi:hypothetical protein